MIVAKHYRGDMCDPQKYYVEDSDYDTVLNGYVVPTIDEIYMISGKRFLCTEKNEKIDRRSGRITITGTYERLYTVELQEDWDEIGANK